MKLIDVISKKYSISKRTAKRYLKTGFVTINNNQVFKNTDLMENKSTIIKLNIKYASINNIDYEKYIIKKNSNIIFLYKPAFVHTERHKLEDDFTLDDVVHQKCANFKLISRLDYQTDGLIAAINNSFTVYDEEKHYIALIHGCLNEILTINNTIDYKKRKKVKVLDQSGSNITTVIPIKRFSNSTIVKIIIKKGLRHQIRAHLAYKGFPIYGDNQYGFKDSAKRLMLSCYYVKINKDLCFSPYLKYFYAQIRKLM